ncbi:MAG: hypothetical protein Q9181_007112, partial [Wetmoreana brouardii]
MSSSSKQPTNTQPAKPPPRPTSAPSSNHHSTDKPQPQQHGGLATAAYKLAQSKVHQKGGAAGEAKKGQDSEASSQACESGE